MLFIWPQSLRLPYTPRKGKDMAKFVTTDYKVTINGTDFLDFARQCRAGDRVRRRRDDRVRLHIPHPRRRSEGRESVAGISSGLRRRVS
jgi:hypothetical protein